MAFGEKSAGISNSIRLVNPAHSLTPALSDRTAGTIVAQQKSARARASSKRENAALSWRAMFTRRRCCPEVWLALPPTIEDMNRRPGNRYAR